MPFSHKKSFFLVLRAKEYRCHHAMLSCLLCLIFFHARFSSKSGGKIKYIVNVHKVASYMQNLGKPPLKCPQILGIAHLQGGGGGVREFVQSMKFYK